MIEGGDGVASLLADQHDFVAGCNAGNVGNVEDRLIHADASDERRTLAADKDTEVISQLTIETVRVPRRNECEPHRLRGDKRAVVADGRAGSNGSHADDPGFPAKHGM